MDNIVQGHYNNFNLLIADPESAYVLSWNDQQLAINHLQPGLYEIVNTPFAPKRSGTLNPANKLWIEEAEGQLSSHPQVCRHGDEYGTRCSHKILVGKHGATKQVWHLDGHPCQGEFMQVLSEDLA